MSACQMLVFRFHIELLLRWLTDVLNNLIRAVRVYVSKVGNSGNMLHREYGSEIDSREAVFRINYAPTAGYEQYVGSRTTFDIVNEQHTKVFVPEVQAGGKWPQAKRAAPRESIITVFEVCCEEFNFPIDVPGIDKWSRYIALDEGHSSRIDAIQTDYATLIGNSMANEGRICVRRTWPTCALFMLRPCSMT